MNSQGFAVDQREKFLHAQNLQPVQNNDVFEDLTNLVNQADQVFNTQTNQGVAHDHKVRYEQEQSLNDKKQGTNLMPLIFVGAALYFLGKK